MLDIIVNDIKTKFAENNLKILNALQNYLSTRKNRDEDILEVCNTYNINFNALKVELMLFGKICPSNNIAENFKAHLNLYFEKDLIGSFYNIYFIYKFFLSILMSSALSERSFSLLRHFKTFTRNTISQETLSNMAILHIEKTFKINFNTIIDQFDADRAGSRYRRADTCIQRHFSRGGIFKIDSYIFLVLSLCYEKNI
jgi:hypothetical protein